MNSELFQNYFNFQMPTAIKYEAVYNTDSEKKNKALLSVMISGLNDLKDEIEQMSEDQINIERPDKMVDIVEKILEFNRKNQEGQKYKNINY